LLGSYQACVLRFRPIPTTTMALFLSQCGWAEWKNRRLHQGDRRRAGGGRADPLHRGAGATPAFASGMHVSRLGD